MNNIYDDEKFFAEYAKMSRSVQGLEGAGEWHQLRGLMPDMEGADVLDLGCGYGWHCRYAAEQGARSVLGIDLSERMISRARELNAAACIEYRVCGLDAFEYTAAAYDCAISNLVLHYVADLDEVYRRVHATLRSGGTFVFNIEHPAFTAGVNQEWVYDEDGRPKYWPMDNYFMPGERETVFLGEKVKKQHHTLEQILMGLIREGFALEAVEEAQPAPEMLDIPGMRDELRRPMMLLVKARRMD